jgi:hypothetical protein
MSTIVSHVILAVDFRAEAPERVVTQWAESLKLNAERTKAKLLAAIPNEERYQSRLAKPATQKFAPFVNPAFKSESGRNANQIIDSHMKNIQDSYRDYRESLDFIFATVDGEAAKRYKEMIDASRQAFSRGIAQRLLPLTGVKAEEMGPVPIATRWLAGDSMVVERLRAADRVQEGGPYLVTVWESRSAFKAALVGRLVQAGSAIIKANLSPTEIATQNNLVNHLVQSNVDPALGLVPFATGADSHVDYILEHNDLWLEVKVSQI